MASPLTGVYQVALDATVICPGTSNPQVSLIKVDGLTRPVRAPMADRDLADGSVVGIDTNEARRVSLTFEIWCPGDDVTAGGLWSTIEGLFAAGGNKTLYVWFPGIGHRSIVGRTRGATDDGLVDLPHGFIEMTCRFDGYDAVMGTE